MSLNRFFAAVVAAALVFSVASSTASGQSEIPPATTQLDPQQPGTESTSELTQESGSTPAQPGTQITQPEPSLLDPDPVRAQINQMIIASGSSEGAAGGFANVETSPKVAEFRQMIMRMRNNDAEINRLIRSMPVGFRDLQEQNRQQVARLRTENAELKRSVGPVAIEAYKEAPNTDRAVLMAVIASLNEALNPGKNETAKFNPELALEITKLLAANDISQPQVLFAGFRAAYAVHDFSHAQAMIEQLAGMNAELNPSVPQQLARTIEKWEREQGLREAEEAADNLPMVRFETSVGDFTAVLYEDHAPETVANFVNLVERGFYNGLTFHIVRPGMMAQSGCPLGNGKGHPGYTIACECSGEEIRHHFAGTLSMFNGGRNTGGSRFFIAQQPNEQLDGRYTVFGRIVENLDVIYEFAAIDKTGIIPDPGEPAVINNVTVLRKRDHEYAPSKLAVLAPVDTRPQQNGMILPHSDPVFPEREDPRLQPPGTRPEPSGVPARGTTAADEPDSGGGVFEPGQAGGSPLRPPDSETAAGSADSGG